MDTRRSKKDGTFPVILRLTHNRKTTSIKTGISLKENDWDEKSGQVKNSYKGVSNVKRLNNELQKKKAEALDKVLKLDDTIDKKLASLDFIRQKINPNTTTSSFYDYADKLVKQLISSDRIGTARSYTGVISILKTFNKGKPLDKNLGGNPAMTKRSSHFAKFKGSLIRDLSFAEINYAFLMKLESYHLGNGNEVNGLAVYMRTIRSIYNQAIKDGIVDRDLYPFHDYKIKTAPTQKRALDQGLLKKIVDLKLNSEDTCFDARNYFVASYLMYGMNFADMAHLKKTDCKNGRVQYRRRKTSKLYDIKITENLKEIFKHYSKSNAESPYVFPIIKRDTTLLQERDIQWARKSFNTNLKSIAESCGIEQTLTSYVSRHSFATHAMMSDIPVTAISAMLGHSSIKTTEIYLKGLPSTVLDDYNARLLKP